MSTQVFIIQFKIKKGLVFFSPEGHKYFSHATAGIRKICWSVLILE